MFEATRVLVITGVSLCLGLTGCQSEPNEPAPPAAAETDGDHSDHDHADHSHTDRGDTDHPAASPLPEAGPSSDAHSGESHHLGTVTIAGATLDISMIGAIAPKVQMHFDVVQTAGPTLSTIRLWIGDESAVGSLKVKSDANDNHFHAHVEAPDMLAMDSKLWIEARDAAGAVQRTSLPLSS
jgi:hypothetical protein